MAVNIGPRIGIEGEEKYRSTLINLIQTTKTYDATMKSLESTFSANDSNMSKAAQRSSVLTKEVTAQAKRVKELEKAVEESGKKYGETDTKTLKWKESLEAAKTKLEELKSSLADNNAIKAFGDDMQAAGQKMSSFGTGMTNAGRTLTRTVTTPIIGLGAYAVKQAADFDSGMSKVQAISGVTADEMQILRDKAMEMGAATKFTTTEAADALSYMAMAGWKTDQMVGGLPGVMYLAGASGEDLATTSDIVTDAMTAFNMVAGQSQKVMRNGVEVELENTSRFVDVLAAASSNANTNVSMMGESFKYVAPVAGTMGYSIEDTAVALGLMANSGIKASQAGTTLRTLLTRMAKPTKESAAAMQALGIRLDDGHGGMKSFMQVMEELREGFGGLMEPPEEFGTALQALDEDLEAGVITNKEYGDAVEDLVNKTFGAEQAEKARTAAMLAGQRGMAGLLAIVNSSDEDFEKLTKAIQDSEGAATDMYNTMQGNLNGEIEKLKSQTQVLAQSFGEELVPVLTDGVKWLQDMVSKFQQLEPEERKQIIKFGAMAAAAGPLLMAMGGTVHSIGELTTGIGGLVSKVGEVVGKHQAAALATAELGTEATTAATSTGALGSAMGILPFAAVGIGLAGFVAAMLAYKESLREATPVTDELKNKLAEFDSQLAASQASFGSLMEGISSNSANINATGTGPLQVWIDQLGECVTAEGQVKAGAEEAANFILNNLNQALGTDFQVSANGFVENAQGVVQSLADINTSIDAMVTKMQQQSLTSAISGDYTTALQEQQTATANAETATTNYSTALDNLIAQQQKFNEVRAQWQAEIDADPEAGASITTTDMLDNQRQALEEAKQVYEEAKNQMTEAAAQVAAADEAVKLLDESMRTLAEGTPESVEAVKTAYGEIPGKVEEVNAQVSEDMAAALEQLKTDMLAGGEQGGDNLANGLSSKKDKSQTAGNDLSKAAAKGAENGKKDMESAANAVVDGFINTIRNRRHEVETEMAALANAGTGASADALKTGSPSKVMEQQGSWTVQGYVNGIRRNLHEVARAGAAIGNAAIYPTEVSGYTATDSRNIQLSELLDAVRDGVHMQNNVEVKLTGDAEKLFRVQQKKGWEYIRRTGSEVFE